jgi:hypothetical protein
MAAPSAEPDRNREGPQVPGERHTCAGCRSSSVQPERDRVVADAEDLRCEEAGGTDEQSGQSRPQHHRRHGGGPLPLQPVCERDREARGRSGRDPQHGEAQHLARVRPRRERSGERGTAAEEDALDDGRGDGTDEHTAEDAALRSADDFFECEDDAGDRRVEDCRNTGCRADRNHAAHDLLRQAQETRERDRDAAGHDDDRTFGAERRTGAERQRRGDEGRHDGARAEDARVVVVGHAHAREVRADRARRKAADQPCQHREGDRRRRDDEDRSPRLGLFQRAPDQLIPRKLDVSVEQYRHDAGQRSGTDERDQQKATREELEAGGGAAETGLVRCCVVAIRHGAFNAIAAAACSYR